MILTVFKRHNSYLRTILTVFISLADIHSKASSIWR